MQEHEGSVTIEKSHATRRMNTRDAILMAEATKPRAKNKNKFLKNRARNKVAKQQRKVNRERMKG